MTAIYNMAKLDFYTTKSQNSMYLSLAMVLGLFALMGTSFTVLSITAAWFTALLSVNIFTIQEKNDLDRLYASLSLRLEHMVAGRYLFLYAGYFAALLLSILIGGASAPWHQTPVRPEEIMTALCVSLLAFTLIAGVQLPVYFRLGYSRAKIWCLVPFLAVMLVVVLPAFSQRVLAAVTVISRHHTFLWAGCLAASLLILTVSLWASIICCRQRQ